MLVALEPDLPYLLLDCPSFQLEPLVMLVALEPDLLCLPLGFL